MAKIRFEKVGKAFKDVVVIKELDLTIHDGEFFTFVGPSGCGKSTILNMVAGLEPVTDGKISFDDIAVNDLSPKERDVAMVFQSYALYPHMSVYENIAFPLRMKKASKETIDSEARRVTSILGLEDLLRRRPKELSGGQRQRVALGRAIIRRPKVFLMDEPLSNLDARLRVEMRAEIKRLHQELKITTVYVTHDQAEAMSLSDRMAVLTSGEIQQCGTPMDVYSKPSNLFVAEFIGSPQMNIIEGVLLKDIAFIQHIFQRFSAKGVSVGIRPGDLEVTKGGDGTGLKGEAVTIEPTGGEVWVDGLWKGVRIKGRALPEVVIKLGEEVFFKAPPDKLHIFDKTTGVRLG